MQRVLATSQKYIAILAGTLILVGLYLTSLYNYLLFHSLAEIFSIVVACAIFMVAWNSRRFFNNNYLLFIGIAYLFIGGLDTLHTLAYKGMGVFQGFDANLPTQLWIAARYVESLSLLTAFFFLRRKLKASWVFLGYATVTALLLTSIFYWGIFPDSYIEGQGLTPFKKISEYIISLILLAAVVLLRYNRRHFDASVLRWLTWSLIFTIGSELAFTSYISVYGFSNLVGHYFKIISFYLIYKAIIETGFSKPYDLLFRDLKQNEEKFRTLVQSMDDRVFILDRDQRIIGLYGTWIGQYRVESEEFLGHTLVEVFGPEAADIHQKAHQEALNGRSTVYEWSIGSPDLTLHLQSCMSPLRDSEGKIIGVVGVGRDITQRVQNEAEREKLIAELQQALDRVKTLSGLLPICASCKRIRNDQGYWEQVEIYVRDHSEADFTHGLCPACAKKLYPELYQADNAK